MWRRLISDRGCVGKDADLSSALGQSIRGGRWNEPRRGVCFVFCFFFPSLLQRVLPCTLLLLTQDEGVARQAGAGGGGKRLKENKIKWTGALPGSNDTRT